MKTNNFPPPPVPLAAPAKVKVQFQSVSKSATGHRVVEYGPGGIGKSTLACMAPGLVAFVDADESLGKLQYQLKAAAIELPLVIPAHDWTSLRSALQSDGYDKVKTIVLDSVTKIEEWAIAYTLATVKNEKKTFVTKIEDYGYGKGYQYVYETFLPLLSDLDRHVRAGRNVILVAHDCVKTVPNPEGADWIRWEPKLQDQASGKASIRLRVKEWSDHTLFYGYDVAVETKNDNDKVGKARGSGTRTIYTSELPHFMAKSRTTSEPIPVKDGENPWAAIIK